MTKLDIREFSSENVPSEIKMKILDAARATGSGLNMQHWRFILVQESDNIKKLTKDSTSGKWVAKANFAIIVLTNPNYNFHMIDAGRVVQDMQLAAWNFGVVSCLFTGINVENLRSDFSVPEQMQPSIVVGFGYPAKKILGKKNRLPLDEIAFLEKYDTKLDSQKL
ncbi:MAG TPA: nitroreductase family protein [Nitrososphaerales archaeon]